MVTSNVRIIHRFFIFRSLYTLYYILYRTVSETRLSAAAASDNLLKTDLFNRSAHSAQ